MNHDADALCVEAASKAAWRELDKRVPQQPNRSLFHYTSLSGLHGILTSGVVWASHSEFLNDPTEIRYARAVIEEVLTSEQPRLAASEEFFREHLWNAYHVAAQADIFIASYSERADDLKQWIAYTPGAAGVSIGFRPAFFRDGITRRVLYGRKQQEALIRHALGIYSNAYALASSADDRDDQIERLGNEFSVLIHYQSFYLKDPSFADEREWRTVTYEFRDQHLPRFRLTETALVPYVEIPLQRDENRTVSYPINRVVLGPGLDGRNVKSISAFVAQYAKGADVVSSNVPFRKVR